MKKIMDFMELVREQGKLKEMREAAKIKQKEVAREFGISQGLLSRIEKGDVKISCEKLMKFYDFYKRIIEGKEEVENIGGLSKKIIFVYEEEEIRKAIKIMKKYDFSQLPVKNRKEEFVGSIDEDCLLGVKREEKIRKVMKELFPIFPYNMEKKRVVEFFKNNPEVKAILISKEGEIIGIVTRYDLYAMERESNKKKRKKSKKMTFKE